MFAHGAVALKEDARNYHDRLVEMCEARVALYTGSLC
jgi:hypothetical protein